MEEELHTRGLLGERIPLLAFAAPTCDGAGADRSEDNALLDLTSATI